MSSNLFRRPSHALAGILIAIGGCAESPSAPAARELQVVQRAASPSFNRAGGTASALIDARGGTIVTPGGQTLVFPAGALATPTQITVRDDANVVGVEVEPHGLVFPAGHEPVLTLEPRGVNVSGLDRRAVVYLDNATGIILEVLPTADGRANSIRAALPHFSKFAYAGS
jgi:hypothetical protein